jgi:MFS family permease
VAPRRYTVLGVLAGAYFLCYLDRMAMASAIPFIAQDLHLSTLVMGEVLSAFFVGYALMQIPGGVLADRFGPRLVLTGAIAWWSLMTAMTAVVPGLLALLAIRVLFGMGEGPFPAAAYKALKIWCRAEQLGRASGLQQAATALGATAAPIFVTAMIVHWGWRAMFAVLMLPGLIFVVAVWQALKFPVRSNLSASTKTDHLKSSAAVIQAPRKGSFLEAIRTPALRWCAAALFLSNTVSWGLMNWLPTYLLQARGFPIERMGVFAAITNFAGVAGYLLGGIVCDRYFAQSLRVPIIAGLVLSAACTYLATTVSTGEWAVMWLAAEFLLSNICFTAIFTLPLVIVPEYAVGSAFGIVNAAGQIAGIVAPLGIGYLLSITHGNFQTVLYVMVLLTGVAILPAIKIRQRSRVPSVSLVNEAG